MKKRKLRRLAAAAACTVLLQTAAMLPVSAADYIFSDGFESGAGGWEGRGGASVQTTTTNPYAGTGALAVTLCLRTLCRMERRTEGHFKHRDRR